MYDVALSAETLIIPSLEPYYKHELLPLIKHRVKLMETFSSDMMRKPSLSQELLDNTFCTLPMITHAQCTFFVSVHFCTMDFKAQADKLDNNVSLYTFCPMDMAAPSYTAAVTENNKLHTESFTSNRATTDTTDCKTLFSLGYIYY